MNQTIEDIFNTTFYPGYRTRLVGGAEEPFYEPAKSPGDDNLVYYREDFAASALHEVAHWCIAGRRRRQLPDFGYWYQPDGRSAEQQRAFEAVEVKPQAIEWHFARACGLAFRVSADNLDGERGNPADFVNRVAAQARAYCVEQALPERAREFRDALARHFAIDALPDPAVFSSEIAA